MGSCQPLPYPSFSSQWPSVLDHQPEEEEDFVSPKGQLYFSRGNDCWGRRGGPENLQCESPTFLLSHCPSTNFHPPPKSRTGPLLFNNYPGHWGSYENNTGQKSGPGLNHCFCHILALWLWSLCPQSPQLYIVELVISTCPLKPQSTVQASGSIFLPMVVDVSCSTILRSQRWAPQNLSLGCQEMTLIDVILRE